jgi:hypothetical protein
MNSIRFASALLFFAIFLLKPSCKNVIEEQGLKSIHLSNINQEVSLSEFCSDVAYIVFETTEQNLIGEVKKILIFNGLIYLLEETGTQSRILLFNTKGDFVKQIGNLGKGPGELSNPRDFIVTDSSIYVWDSALHEFDVYGNYKRKIYDAYFSGNTFLKIGYSIFFFYGVNQDGNYGISYNLDDGSFKNIKIINGTCALFGPHENDAIFNYDENYYLFSAFSDTIFKLTGDSLIPHSNFTFKQGKSLNQIAVENVGLNPYEFAMVLNSSVYSSVNRFMENENYILIQHGSNQEEYLTISNKENLVSLSFNECSNDIDFGIFGIPLLLSESHQFVSLVYPHELEKVKHRIKAGTALHQISETINPNDNPVLIFCELKL